MNYLFYSGSLKAARKILQTTPQPLWTLDFALDSNFQIDDAVLVSGTWRISACRPGTRKIKVKGKSDGDFFSLLLSGEQALEIKSRGVPEKGLFTAAMAYPILKLISVTSNEEDENNGLRIISLTRLLLMELDKGRPKKSPFHFSELKAVFYCIESLNDRSVFPTPAELVRESGIRKFRFQRACLLLYGQPAQKIIQHLKMKWAWEAITFQKKSLVRTGKNLGYRHSFNFITAFHKHFGLTPMEALRKSEGEHPVLRLNIVAN